MLRLFVALRLPLLVLLAAVFSRLLFFPALALFLDLRKFASAPR